MTKHDELEEYQESLQQACTEIRTLEAEKEAMACELNQLEMIVNEQVQKLQEQNQTIQSLGESYMQEANER